MKTDGIKNYTFMPRFAFISILSCLFLFPVNSFSGEWRVTPIRLDLSSKVKSGAITVVNEGADKLHVQMKAFEWTQDAEGKDQYIEMEKEKSDIIFFPKIMIFEKKEERILRVGIKVPAVMMEKTYRLFIEEIPEPKKAEGAQVAIAIRFGVPIFVKPIKEDIKGEIEKVKLSKGNLNIVIKNTGNVHFVISAITIKGKNSKNEGVFSKDLSGWYLLSGVSRLYTTSIPQGICKNITNLDIEVKTDKFNLNRKLDVDKTMCLP